MKKPLTFWAIKNGELLLPFTIRQTRKDAISDYEDHTMKSWEFDREYEGVALKRYCSCVKIEVREVKRP